MIQYIKDLFKKPEVVPPEVVPIDFGVLSRSSLDILESMISNLNNIDQEQKFGQPIDDISRSLETMRLQSAENKMRSALQKIDRTEKELRALITAQQKIEENKGNREGMNIRQMELADLDNLYALHKEKILFIIKTSQELQQ